MSGERRPGWRENVEFKAELPDLPLARMIAKSLGAIHADTMRQIDTYYRVADTRIKRRERDGHETEYIFYDRADVARPRLSSYRLLSEEQALERLGSTPLPTLVRVAKVRELYLLDNVRIHLDSVDDLGRFLEFEAVVSETRDRVQCRDAVRKLRDAFIPAIGEPISKSYSDLVLQQQSAPATSP